MSHLTPHENLTLAGRTRVLITEASKMYCDLLTKAFLGAQDRFEVVGAASSSAEILELIRTSRPHVSIISDALEDGPLAGIRLLPEIRKANVETRILMAMGSLNRETVIEAFRSGADGVFSRTSPFETLCKSVDALAQGQIWANATELRYVLDEFTRAPKQRKVDPLVENRMTKREADVVRLAVEGLSNREIAGQLGLTEHTVKNYLFRVFDKLGVSNRVELVLSCLRQEESVREEAAVQS
jgi:two-component system nitrate/nitrite response regulator NarL